MRPRDYSNINDHASVGVVIGAITGAVGATIATFWGGYEIGSSINDVLGITNIVGRSALDLSVMGLVAGPAYTIGIYGGMAVGEVFCVVAHPVLEGTEELGELISNVYQKFTGKKNDES